MQSLIMKIVANSVNKSVTTILIGGYAISRSNYCISDKIWVNHILQGLCLTFFTDLIALWCFCCRFCWLLFIITVFVCDVLHFSIVTVFTFRVLNSFLLLFSLELQLTFFWPHAILGLALQVGLASVLTHARWGYISINDSAWACLLSRP